MGGKGKGARRAESGGEAERPLQPEFVCRHGADYINFSRNSDLNSSTDDTD